MTIFNSYSKYYNLLYKDKDYQQEVRYIKNIIIKHSPNAKTILELGCGTGKHAKILDDSGFKIHGIDISKTMLEQAKKLQTQNLTFEYGDVRNYRVNSKFDVVISLFHVASYQNSNDDLINYFRTARDNLNVGGIFIFDCWYGPAVLNQKPAKRVKELEDDEIKMVRYANPQSFPNENIVKVNYNIKVTDKRTNKDSAINETHSMRYLFKPEIELLLNSNGFQLIDFQEWITGKTPGFDSWGVCFIGKAI